MGAVKTTMEIPDHLFRQVKARAAQRGQSLKEFVTDALQARLATASEGDTGREPPWMNGFGQLRHLQAETARIQALIDDDLGVVEADDRL